MWLQETTITTNKTMNKESKIRKEGNDYYIPTINLTREKYAIPFEYQLTLLEDRLRFTMKGKVAKLQLVDYDEETEQPIEEWDEMDQDIEFDIYKESIKGYSIKLFKEDRCFGLMLIGDSDDLLNLTFKLRRDARQMREDIANWKKAS